MGGGTQGKGVMCLKLQTPEQVNGVEEQERE